MKVAGVDRMIKYVIEVPSVDEKCVARPAFGLIVSHLSFPASSSFPAVDWLRKGRIAA